MKNENNEIVRGQCYFCGLVGDYNLSIDEYICPHCDKETSIEIIK